MSKIESQRGSKNSWALGTLVGASLLLAFAAGRFWSEPVQHEAHAGDERPVVTQHTPRKLPAHTARSPVSTPTEIADDGIPAGDSDVEPVDPAPTKGERATVLQFDELKQQVETEVRDPAWEREVDARLAATLKEDEQSGTFGGRVSIARTACGSTRCTIEGEAENKRDASSLGRSIIRGVGLTRGRIYTNRRDDGTASVRVVAAREGYDLFGMQEQYLAESN